MHRIVIDLSLLTADTSRLICKSDNSSDSRITAIDWINAHDESLIIIGMFFNRISLLIHY